MAALILQCKTFQRDEKGARRGEILAGDFHGKGTEKILMVTGI